MALVVLYRSGVIPIACKRALVFYGAAGGRKANFTSCTGSIRRILRVRESRSYRFSLKTTLSQGDVCLTLSGPGGHILLHLDSQMGEKEVRLEKGRAYTLKVRFQNATGGYELSWD